ncbi:hypothetical protein RFI_29622 [Reticulomyxa filosa]|uniref:Uncharacterized protein n=1 Tax=Reticulomyxa filosa TaxID=46433 RepID=X6M0T1_RETFI|nr:hypothetical protein RFI_29622 [Reticulomyxa filosa]|eukprot:ETO07768.1 hypothetical protein RFI_29622 [Reticulomyxa filosa]
MSLREKMLNKLHIFLLISYQSFVNSNKIIKFFVKKDNIIYEHFIEKFKQYIKFICNKQKDKQYFFVSSFFSPKKKTCKTFLDPQEFFMAKIRNHIVVLLIFLL